jgi:hypothetical protein
LFEIFSDSWNTLFLLQGIFDLRTHFLHNRNCYRLTQAQWIYDETHVLLSCDMGPGKFFFQIIGLFLLLSCFGCFLESDGSLLESRFEIGNHLPLLLEHFGGLIDVIETRIVFITKLTELRAAKEELHQDWYIAKRTDEKN